MNLYLKRISLHIVWHVSIFIKEFGFNTLKPKFMSIIYKNSARTSQETHKVTDTKPSGYCCLGKQSLFCENHTEHINPTCGQTVDFF
jgi:hypothetical protein